ncbi:MAG TPA: cytochrome c [Arachidicoccus sp.]
MLLDITTPVPRNIPLPLPLPEWLLVTILIVSFLVHIVFVNLMVGGSILTLWYQVKGRKNKDYLNLSYEIARTITVNKSLAVVLGIAPLLSLSVLYPIYFYSATSLTGVVWVALIPLVTIAFLLTYLHKYTFRPMAEKNRGLSVAMIAVATLLFLFIPFIFLVNINLMLFPDKWSEVKGFFSALLLQNVLPRYFHFMCASLAATGLFLFWYMGRKKYPFEKHFKEFTRYEVKKKAYTVTLGATFAQFIFGPLLMYTLPARGFSWELIILILCGVILAIIAMYWMWQSIKGTPENINRHFYKVVVALSITVLFMGTGRHVYRATALAPHQKIMAEETDEFEQLSKEAREKSDSVKTDSTALTASNDPVLQGKMIFQQNCASCHTEKQRLVGPPVLEMVSIYADNKTGLEQWIKKPGKKRPGYPQMPTLTQLTDVDREKLADYILSFKNKK